MQTMWLGPLLLGASLVMGACSGDDASAADATPPADAAPPLFPEDYRDSFTLARDCRNSTSHDSHRILVWASPDAAAAYLSQEGEVPVGGVLLKEEYDFGDVACEDEVLRRTAMKKLPPDADVPPEHLGWYWADYEDDGSLKSENDSHCWGCHDDCDGNPDVVFDDTCAVL